MSRQHASSCDCTKGELDVFATPPTQLSIEGGQWVDTHPNASLTDNGPIEFVVPGDSEQYIDLSNVQLYVEASLKKSDGTDLADTKFPGPVNNFLHSMFEEVEVTLGDTIITPATHAYPYRAYLENLISLNSDCKNTQLTTCLWAKDDYDKMEELSCRQVDGHGAAIDGNSGLQQRGSYTYKSKMVPMVGRLHCDIFSQDRLLLNKVRMRVKLYRSRDAFCIMSNDNQVKVEIKKAILYVRRVDINPTVFNAHQAVLQRSPAVYPIKRVVVKYFQVPRGSTSSNQENLYTGQMPTRLIVGCVDSAAFNGAFNKNPFNFQNKNIREIGIHLAGVKEPIRPLRPNFPDQSLMSYISFLTGVGLWGRNEGCGFNRREHSQGYCLFAWDLTAYLSTGSDHFQLKKDTSMRLEMLFSEPLTHPTNVVIFAEFENMVMIDSDRNVSTNFRL